MSLRVLSWNLKHGRAVPSAGRELFDDFARALDGWAWDVALLQEVPPWWPARLADEHALVLTSRNVGLPIRRAIAQRWPDAIKSNGGGCNAVLGRAHRLSGRCTLRLRSLPERRWMLAVRLEDGTWIGNLHASGRGDAEVQRAAQTLRTWAGDSPAVLGGDFNLRGPELPGFEYAGGFDVDHVFARGLRVLAPAEVLDRGRLSDHAPIAVTLAG